jgi:SnoaL-like domain
MLDEKDLMLALKRHWDYTGRDEDIAHEIYHDDAVLEFPQSGERFEGVANFREWRRRYPAHLAFHTRRITHRDDLAVVENLISYNGAPWMYTVNLLEFRGDKVVHERIYIMDGWQAAEWRAPWRANTLADPPPPPPPSR